MNELLPCGWRETRADHTLRCHSHKYVAPANPVTAEFCRSCSYRDHKSATPSFAALRAKCELREYEHRVHSQYGEDGIIAEILRRTRTQGLAVEIGAHFEYGNCYHLAEQGRPVLFIERDRERLQRLANRIHGANVSYKLVHVTAENVNAAVPAETSFLSIDIDGNDYWIWKALRPKPAVVVIEFNHIHAPPLRKVIRYDPDFQWDGSTYSGASLSALHELGARKGYALVATDSVQCNAYFVLSKFADRFQRVTPKQLWYHPGWTHPPSVRKMEDLAGS